MRENVIKFGVIRRFFVYGFVGLIMEVLWTGFLSFLRGDYALECRTSLLMFPVYAMAVMLEPLFVHLLKSGIHIIARGCIYAMLIFFAEYTTGGIYTLLGICPWNYTGARFGINGLIRLDYAFLWVFAGLFFERLYFWLCGLCYRGEKPF
jgi:uncharacterized membrane protein